MSAIDELRVSFRTAKDPVAFLRKRSGLPGPRGNLELLHAFVEEAPPALIRAFAALGPDAAPENTPDGFVACCGVAGLGRLAAEGDRRALPELRRHASDPRWRVREGVAMALQRLGETDPRRLVREMRRWAGGTALERSAVVAALCEPPLLADPATAAATLELLDGVTASLTAEPDRRDADVRTLRKALAYGWSVAVAAAPDAGRPAMERWLASDDPDVRWVMRENLKKARLAKAGPGWVARWRRRLRMA